MSHLGHFKLSMVVFTLGLLFIVSEVAEDGDDSSAIEIAAASVAEDLSQKDQLASANPWASSTLGVSRFGDAAFAAPSEATYRPPITPASPVTAISEQEGLGTGTSLLPPPTRSMLHK